jgi:hypothetical protein
VHWRSAGAGQHVVVFLGYLLFYVFLGYLLFYVFLGFLRFGWRMLARMESEELFRSYHRHFEVLSCQFVVSAESTEFCAEYIKAPSFAPNISSMVMKPSDLGSQCISDGTQYLSLH